MDGTWKIHWRDVVCMVAAVWLMVTVPAKIATAVVYSGWLAYLCGAFIVLMGFAAWTDRSPALSWAMAVAGLVVAATPLLTGILDETAAMISFFAVGLVTVVFASWSALTKRSEHKQRAERRRRAAEPATQPV